MHIANAKRGSLALHVLNRQPICMKMESPSDGTAIPSDVSQHSSFQDINKELKERKIGYGYWRRLIFIYDLDIF